MFWSLWLVLVTLVGTGVHWMLEGRPWLGGITFYFAASWMMGLMMASVFRHRNQVLEGPITGPQEVPQVADSLQELPGRTVRRPRRTAKAAWREWAARDLEATEPALRPGWVRVAAQGSRVVGRD